jgi:hypothetical protein
MKTYWLSFVVDGKNMGVIITDAPDEKAAIRKTWQMGINPGGEVLAFERTGDLGDTDEEILLLGKDRLISPEELTAQGYKKISELPPEQAFEWGLLSDVGHA